MGVREQIMAFGTTANDKYLALKHFAADIAEARERELLAERAAMIAELENLERWCEGNNQFSSCSFHDVMVVVNKYEVHP
jgi:hypothetical protein